MRGKVIDNAHANNTNIIKGYINNGYPNEFKKVKKDLYAWGEYSNYNPERQNYYINLLNSFKNPTKPTHKHSEYNNTLFG